MDLLEFYGALRSLWAVWFMALFIGIVWWAFGRRRRPRFEQHARIPLRED